MRAVVVPAIGDLPEPRDIAEPSARDGESLIEVLAAPLNPIDLAVAAGRFYGGHPDPPYVPGCEAVGRVVESESWDRGALVWAYGAEIGHTRDGVMAQRATVPDSALCAVPEDIDAALAGALGIAGMAGWLTVAWRAPVQEGETVLVLGATGVVGSVALQGARLLGAGRVVAAGRSAAALRRAAELGADAIVNVTESDDLASDFRAACGGDGPSLVIDPLWGEPLVAAAEAAARGARIVNVGQSAGATAEIRSAAVRGKGLQILGHANSGAPRDVLEREYARLLEHARAGDVRVEIARFALDDVAHAWHLQSGSPGAKLVLEP
ncbi:MAG: zinc-binding alcohol dehydrogenase family protein [Actinobacteria bacterium]|nr:zinc-binding alcohol dehydrogenase family protein [Actinomycetota bacterium]